MSESFDEAVARFQEFLKKNGHTGKIAWLEPDDVLLSGSRVVYVKLRPNRDNEKVARLAFDSALAQGRGVCLKGLFEIGDVTYSSVWVPRDDSEAELALLPQGVKLSVLSGEYKPIGRGVRSRLGWLILLARYHRRQKLKHQIFY